jgi:hypothetical protein
MLRWSGGSGERGTTAAAPHKCGTSNEDAARPFGVPPLGGGSLRGHDHETIAASLGMSPGSLRTALTRLLDSFRDLLREEVAETVEDKAEIEDEITHLMKAFERA